MPTTVQAKILRANVSAPNGLDAREFTLGPALIPQKHAYEAPKARVISATADSVRYCLVASFPLLLVGALWDASAFDLDNCPASQSLSVVTITLIIIHSTRYRLDCGLGLKSWLRIPTLEVSIASHASSSLAPQDRRASQSRNRVSLERLI